MINIRLDRVIADRKISSKDLAKKIGISEANLSKIKTGRAKAIRLSTLNNICKHLKCQPRDIFEYQHDLED